MIFATNARGEATFVGPEWTAMTGETTTDALELGWLRKAHPDDQGPVRSILDRAIRARLPFSMRYRLLRTDGRYIWVAAGAAPSFGVTDDDLVGFVGSLTPFATSHSDDVQAYGTIGRLVPLPEARNGTRLSTLDRVADHLLIVESLLSAEGRADLFGAIRLALYMVGHELVADEGVPPPSILQ